MSTPSSKLKKKFHWDGEGKIDKGGGGGSTDKQLYVKSCVCVTKMMCDKVECKRLCMSVMMCNKHVCVWKMVHDKVACDKVVCERWCVCVTKWCVIKMCVCVTKLCDKEVC